MHQAECIVHCNSSEEAAILFSSLSPELQQGIPKTRICLKQQDSQLVLSITTSDCSSLRAACNSYLRWLHTAQQVHQLL